MLRRWLASTLASFAVMSVALDADAAPEPHSAHQMVAQAADDLVAASVELRVEPVVIADLKFFAIQVGFPNGVAAHGGPQVVGSDLKANWGALTSNANYAYDANTPVSVRLDALEQMQNAAIRTDAFAWSPNVWYRLEVVRGDVESLPAGDYSVLDEPKVTVDHARSMRKWTFSIRQLDTQAVVLTMSLHVASETMNGFMYWTETGYGVTCDEKIRVHWRSPKYTSASKGEGVPTKITKSIAQSTCSSSATSDIRVESTALMGTLQTFGAPRPSTSKDGDVLYPYSGPPLGEDGNVIVPTADAGPNDNGNDAGNGGASDANATPTSTEDGCTLVHHSASSTNGVTLMLMSMLFVRRVGRRAASSIKPHACR